MAADAPHPRPKRRDAALNNDRLVQAAREVFARQGLSATLEDIATHAGVGVGTIYRNFASKRQIIETLYDAAIDSALADVQAALEIEDPWLAIVTFFEITAENQARDRGLGETLLGHGATSRGAAVHGRAGRGAAGHGTARDATDHNSTDTGTAGANPAGGGSADHNSASHSAVSHSAADHGGASPSAHAAEKLVATLTPLFERAIKAGAVREGVTATDVWPIFTMLNSIYTLSDTNPDLWRRYLALLLDGLRATDRPPLPEPALDLAAFTAALAAGR